MKLLYDKDIIRRSFSRAAKTYDLYSDFQKEAAEELLAHAFIENKDSLLDAGCGTGSLIKELKKLHPSIKIYGMDISIAMLSAAKEKLDRTPSGLFAADCEDLPIRNSIFDIVISNLTYQWVKEPLTAFKEVSRILRPDGEFILSTLGPSTFKELRESIKEAQHLTNKNGLPPFMKFRGLKYMSKALETNGFRIIGAECSPRIRYYRNLPALLKTLKYIGAQNPLPSGNNTLARGLLLKEAERVYKKNYSNKQGEIMASYEVIFLRCKKSCPKLLGA